MILVTGATGFLGKRVCRLLDARNMRYEATSKSLGVDLCNFEATLTLFKKLAPTHVLNCASFTGGLQFGLSYPADIFRNNMPMIANLFEASRQSGVRRIVNPLPNCVYPAALTLFTEDKFWDGPLHESVMVYGLLRKTSWAGSWAYKRQYGLDTLNLVLSNMYGPEDHFDERRSHAVSALVKRFVEGTRTGAPEVVVWGTGTPVREWLYVDDGAEAMVRGLSSVSEEAPVNVGMADGVSVKYLAELICECVGYKGKIVFDATKPDGAPHKIVDGTRGRALLDWSPTTTLKAGIPMTVDWYLQNCGTRGRAERPL